MANVKTSSRVRRDIAKRSAKASKKELTNRFSKQFKEIKEEMIEEFLAHPVTIEILSGPKDRQRISGTLGGQSNLFAFIGFPAGSDPIQPILDILESTSYKVTRDGFRISLPTAQDIFAVTPMPWAAGRSWARGIERGIPGLGRLLNIPWPTSLSGEAIQAKKKVRGGGFEKTQYVSALMKKYKKKFSKLTK